MAAGKFAGYLFTVTRHRLFPLVLKHFESRKGFSEATPARAQQQASAGSSGAMPERMIVLTYSKGLFRKHTSRNSSLHTKESVNGTLGWRRSTWTCLMKTPAGAKLGLRGPEKTTKQPNWSNSRKPLSLSMPFLSMSAALSLPERKKTGLRTFSNIVSIKIFL